MRKIIMKTRENTGADNRSWIRKAWDEAVEQGQDPPTRTEYEALKKTVKKLEQQIRMARRGPCTECQCPECHRDGISDEK